MTGGVATVLYTKFLTKEEFIFGRYKCHPSEMLLVKVAKKKTPQ